MISRQLVNNKLDTTKVSATLRSPCQHVRMCFMRTLRILLPV